MKKPSLNHLLPVVTALATLVLASCASTPQSRIANNPELFNSLPAPHRTLAGEGRISEGMGPDAVYFAWGKPDAVNTRSDRGRVSETWVYSGVIPEQVSSAWGHFGYPGFRGYGYGPYCYGWGPQVIYRRYVAGSVTFRGNEVVQWGVNRPR